MVRSRKVARNYGHSYSVAFVKGLHSESDSYVDKYDGTLRCGGQMSWCVKKVKTYAAACPFYYCVVTEVRARMLRGMPPLENHIIGILDHSTGLTIGSKSHF